jgi:hypothetical protein
VLIVVSDATRATASGQVVNLLIRRLIQLGVAPHDLRIIFATGIHRPVNAAEKRELLTPFVLQRIRTLDHDAEDATQHVQFGTTEGGTPVELNRALAEHDHVILTGAINFHYFAGFTGGRKSICPGLASARSIAATHLHALDFETGGRRAGVGTEGSTATPSTKNASASRPRSRRPFFSTRGRTSAARPCASTRATGARRTVWAAPSMRTRTRSGSRRSVLSSSRRAEAGRTTST